MWSDPLNVKFTGTKPRSWGVNCHCDVINGVVPLCFCISNYHPDHQSSVLILNCMLMKFGL